MLRLPTRFFGGKPRRSADDGGLGEGGGGWSAGPFRRTVSTYSPVSNSCRYRAVCILGLGADVNEVQIDGIVQVQYLTYVGTRYGI
jgi:hypothetical protein